MMCSTSETNETNGDGEVNCLCGRVGEGRNNVVMNIMMCVVNGKCLSK